MTPAQRKARNAAANKAKMKERVVPRKLRATETKTSLKTVEDVKAHATRIYGLDAAPVPKPAPGPLPPRPWRLQDYAGFALTFVVLDANNVVVCSVPYHVSGRDYAARLGLAIVDAMNNATALQVQEWER